MRDDDMTAAARPSGAPGGSGNVVADAWLLYAEQPPALHAWTRYVYAVAGVSPVSAWPVAVPATVVTSVKPLEPPLLRSMRYSAIGPSGALHDSVIWDADTVVAPSAPGAPGGNGCVVAVASLLGGEQPTELHAITRHVYSVAAARPVLSYARDAAFTRSISRHAPVPVRWSIRYSSTVPVAPCHARSTRDGDTTVATRSPGAPGGTSLATNVA